MEDKSELGSYVGLKDFLESQRRKTGGDNNVYDELIAVLETAADLAVEEAYHKKEELIIKLYGLLC